MFGQSVSASPKQTQFEVLAAQLTMRPTVHVTVVCIYRPPASVSRQFCEKLAGLLDQLVTAKQQFIVCGDFNCPGNDQLYSPHMVVTIYRYTIENNLTKKRKYKEEKNTHKQMACRTCRLRSIYKLMKVRKLVRWLSDLINLSRRLAI